MAVSLLVWGVADDARVQSEMEALRPEFRVAPVELVGGKFSMVDLGNESGTAEDQKAYVERLISRTDIFLSYGGRSSGLPVFLPVVLIVGLLGWIRLAPSRFWAGWMWTGVRLGGVIGLVMSQAPYGSQSDMVIYMGSLIGNGGSPILEALLAVSVRLSLLWPSGVVSF